jgi:hypothetical protein
MNHDLYAPSQFSMPIVHCADKVELPAEYLQQIEGSYDEVPFHVNRQPIIAITSITFKSNFKAYGPYGKPGKDTFKSECGKIVGFWGGYGLS